MSVHEPERFGPWNPGIDSQIPRHVFPLSTMFRAEHAFTDYSQAQELSGFSGLTLFDVVRFRPERLTAHEMLVRVTADLSVRDGPNYEDLGISLRGMVTTLLEKHVAGHRQDIQQEYEELRERTQAFLALKMAALYEEPKAQETIPAKRSFLKRVFSNKGTTPKASRLSDAERVKRVVARWKREGLAAPGDFQEEALHSAIKVVETFFAKNGRLAGGKEVLITLATTLVLNRYGSVLIGKKLDELLPRAIAAEGFARLPTQKEPIVMNVKGASASGKSSMRALQRELAERLNVPWEDFALISPDYWRKFLLDYDSLGEAYKYAGMLTGHELAIIDKKLDRHMAKKGQIGDISHLLIDRFRFDSFSTGDDGKAEGRLLTRFGDRVFLFFMVTPPEATVERAWYRGLDTGRYKAVEDLLYHNVEAYRGMPALFFFWVLSENRKIHFEFLDNSVKKGQRPRTIAFGSRNEINILDLDTLANIDRFRKINVEATHPGEVHRNNGYSESSPSSSFIQNCIDRLERVRFLSWGKKHIIASITDGTLTDWQNNRYSLSQIPDLTALVRQLQQSAGKSDRPERFPPTGSDYVVGQ